MADTITFRPDEDAARALAALTRDGTPVSTAVRSALIAAARERARAALRVEAEALAADEQDPGRGGTGPAGHGEPACVVRSTGCGHLETTAGTSSGVLGTP